MVMVQTAKSKGHIFDGLYYFIYSDKFFGYILKWHMALKWVDKDVRGLSRVNSVL